MSPDSPEYNPILIAEEISRILESDSPMKERLERIVGYLKRATHVDACTLYRHSPKSGDVFLECSDGLAAAKIGQRAMRSDEGLTGLVIRSRKPLAVRDGPSHPQFRYIPGIHEESFHSYLGVPIQNGRRVIGALVTQTAEPRDFDRDDIALLNTIARQLAASLSPLFRRLDREGRERRSDSTKAPEEARGLSGRTLAPGCFLGPPVVLDFGMRLERIYTPPSRGVKTETRAIRRANRVAMAELEKDARAVSGSEGHAVLIAHKVILEDDELATEVIGLIEQGHSAAEAVRLTALRWTRILENQADPAFRARAADFRDIANRLFRALGIEAISPAVRRKKVVALARSLLPDDLIRHGPDRIGALVLIDQGVHSHTAILARSFGIPAVQLDAELLDQVRLASQVLVDGAEAVVILDPEPEVAALHIDRSERAVRLPEGGPESLRGRAQTTDGVTIRVSLNAGLLSEFQRIETFAPDDIGLYRTEIPFMSRTHLPPLRTQISHYKKVIALAGGRAVTFRTFDFGGDKLPPSIHLEPEENPMMGFRSTRFLLANESIFRTQLRALLTVSSEGPISILVPMISTPEEFNLVLDEINAIRNELDRTGVKFDRNVPIGIMLEVPSVLFSIDELSRSADFFCVGSNDLVQYLMAADRSNPRVAWLYQWHHPAVLSALDFLGAQCRRSGRPVTVCGEMANHPWAALLLIGMGYERLSVDFHSVPLIKWILLQLSSETMRAIADRAKTATSSTEVIEIFYAALEKIKIEAPPLAELLATPLERLRANSPW